MPFRRAFTFVELMIVLTIIAVLCAIAVPNFLEARVRADVARVHADLAVVKMALEAYRLDVRAYPPGTDLEEMGGPGLAALTTPVAYLSCLPSDIFSLPSARGSRHVRETRAAPYSYHNGIEASPETGVRFAPPRPGRMDGFVAALLWSIGPDESIPAAPGEPATVLEGDGRLRLLAYDPTNGTMSPGDIYLRVP